MGSATPYQGEQRRSSTLLPEGWTIAALDAQGCWIPGDGCRPVSWEQLRTVNDLLTAMVRRRVRVLHVHRSALELLELPGELPTPAPGERRPAHPWLRAGAGWQLSTSALAPWTAARTPAPTDDGPPTLTLEVGIGAYQVAGGDPFADAIDGAELLGAVIAFAEALAAPRPFVFRQSCAQTGWHLMHSPWGVGSRRRPLEQAGPEVRPALEGVAPGEQIEVPYGGAWALPKSRRLPRGWWVRAFDVNGQRLAACSRLRLGVGAVEHYTGELAQGALAEQLPGYHRVTALRRPFRCIPAAFELGWHTTPRVAMAAYLGLEPQVSESWVWPEHLPYLDPFYDRLRQARTRLLAGETRGAAIALGALKQCYLQPLGRLRSAKLGAKGDVRYRPSWYDAVIGQELAREYLRLHQLAEAGELVLAVYFDTIITVVPEPDYTPAALEVSEQLGKWRPMGGPLELADARSVLYGGDDPDVGALVRALKAAGAANGAAPAPPNDRAPAPVALSAHTRPTHGGYPG